MKLVLASTSASRRAMLDAAGVPFQASDPGVDENLLKTGARDGLALALRLAEAKASAIDAPASTLVLGADQTLVLDDGRLLDKAATMADAADQLRSLSGRTHRLHAAAALVENGVSVWRCAETATMYVRPLSEKFIRDYLDAEWEAVRWSVGCYHLEARGAQLFDRIEGSHFAVLGLPLLPLLAELRARGVLPS